MRGEKLSSISIGEIPLGDHGRNGGTVTQTYGVTEKPKIEPSRDNEVIIVEALSRDKRMGTLEVNLPLGIHQVIV